MISDLNQLAKKIVENNEYLALATVDAEKSVWICIICYAQDKDFNFYFASIDTSRHSKNISKNKAVSFAIYDSRQDWGTGVGLQIEGTVEKVKPREISKATATYFSRKYPYGKVSGVFAEEFKKLLQKKTYSFYKITPTRIWINNPNANVDERVEVKLS